MTAARNLELPVARPIARVPRPISALPVLSPDMLFGRRRRSMFPLGEPRRRLFYLGRGAVWHAMDQLGLRGAEVLVPAYHHGVEVEAMLNAGVKPRFYGVRRSFDVDLASMADEITPETKAIYVIHYIGFPQPMDDILALARPRGLKVIEDCALALLSSSGQRPLGARGDAAIYCLYKTLPVPHGGALWLAHGPAEIPLRSPSLPQTLHQMASSMLVRFEGTGTLVGAAMRGSASALARAARAVRPLPVDSRPVGGRRFVPGQENLAASPLAQQIVRRLDLGHIVDVRRRNYFALMGRLRDISPPMVQELAPGVCPLFYPLWCERKRTIQARLAEARVESIDFWSEGSPLVPRDRFPEVAALRAHVLELPIHQDLELTDIDALAEAVRQALAESRC